MFKKLLILALFPSLAKAICPVGFTQMGSNHRKCFMYVYEIYMTAEQASNRCRNLGYNLLTIDSQEENDELIDIIVNCDKEICGSAWIGLTYDNSTRRHSWNDGYPTLFTSINESSPYCDDGYFGRQYFISWDGFWYNCPATSYFGRVHGVLCEFRTDCPQGWLQSKNDPTKCISTQINQQNFFSASTQACDTLVQGSNVAQVFSADENHELLVASTAQAIKCRNGTNPGQFYIDLVYQESKWQWFHGDNSKNITYFNWRSGYPQNLENNACVMLNIDDGTWTNEDCLSNACFVCEKTIPQS